ncbi:hypothetical protein [Lamprocystis purpurea]|jgi:hypothetical protein|uniref:hypothetical protein n=1 Tax=Lamprocystis purpurea TaxID=61598 RepID=UPI0003A6AE50|nr:hypothetical protein [Lamprocystis purpurea]
MRPALPVVAAAFLTLGLSGAALVQAETQSEKMLDAAAFAESEDPTQVKEEEAIEKKDGMDAPADTSNAAAPAASDAAEVPAKTK